MESGTVRDLRQGTLPPCSIALTFDDGFHNFFSAAVPRLEDFGLPATNYVSTYHCVHQRPILRLKLRYLLWRARAQVLTPGALPGQGRMVDLQNLRQRWKLVADLLAEAQKLSDDRDAQCAWVGDVASRHWGDLEDATRSRPVHLMMGAGVADMAHRGFGIQPHTHRHRSPREKTAFCEGVLENRRILEGWGGRPVSHFCCPSGDVDPVFLPWLRELQVETATTTYVSVAGAQHDPLLLPRCVDTMVQSEMMFESWLSGAGAIVSRWGA